jgi:nucleotide-binding universal stress UspA family protein
MSMAIRSILVPTDFSPHADAALERAAQLARRLSARVYLLHAYYLGTEAGYPLPAQLIDQARAQAREQLERAAKALAETGVSCESHTSPLVTVSAILEQARALPADLIVMGTRGLSGLKHVLLGSVAERTVRLAPCPVMTVKAGLKRAGVGAKILVPTDLSPLSLRAVRYALELGRALGEPKLVLAHACHLPAQIEIHALEHHSGLLQTLTAQVALELQSRGKELLGDSGVPCAYVARIGRPEDVVRDVASEEECDCVVMTTHGRTGIAHAALGSVAERVLRLAPCPVVTLKD